MNNKFTEFTVSQKNGETIIKCFTDEALDFWKNTLTADGWTLNAEDDEMWEKDNNVIFVWKVIKVSY